MSILIPTIKGGIAEGDPALLDFGVTQTPPMGGPALRYNRLGNRFKIDVTMPELDTATDGRVVVSRLLQGMTQGVLFAFPVSIAPGNPGSPVVNGAGQTGSSLRLKNFAPGYVMREGQFGSLIYAGRRYLHAATADTAADSNGNMLLPITPMLRISPNDGATFEVAVPYIEGFLPDGQVPWKLPASPQMTVQFTITEAA